MKLVALYTVILCSGVLSWAPPKPTPEVLAWTKREIGAFFSFNMISELKEDNTQYFCIHVGGDATSVVGPQYFNPWQINLDDWLEVAASFGAKYAVLTAQHCSGFSMWPTDIYEATGYHYNYSIQYAPLDNGKYDVVQAFIDSCKKYNIAPGIYYSLNQNFYLNVAQGKVMDSNNLAPGQVNVSQELYNKIALAQMTELWSHYGELSELWFDGGCIPGLEKEISNLTATLQPHAVYFGGCSQTNNIRWVGTESGEPSYPIWSTSMATEAGCVYGTGDSNGPVFCPAETDTTLQLFDKWFYRGDDGYRNLTTLKTIYMKSVGQNTNLLLNVAANASGLIPDTAREIYKSFGDWIKSCFGTPVAKTSGTGYSFTLQLNPPANITKVSVSEDQTDGEMVTRFTITVTTTTGASQPVVTVGQSIGNKFIADLGELVMAAEVNLVINNAFDTPNISDFSVYECVE